MLTRQCTDLAVDHGDAEWRLLKSQAFDELVELGRETTMSTSVAPSLAHQTRQSLPAVALHPSPERPQWHLVLVGNVGECDVLFEKGAHHLETHHGLGPLLHAQMGQQGVLGSGVLALVKRCRHGFQRHKARKRPFCCRAPVLAFLGCFWCHIWVRNTVKKTTSRDI